MTEPLQTDRALVMCCDRSFFPYTLFVCRQVTVHCPFRGFDIVIVTQDDLTLPDWARDAGIRVHQMGDMDPAAEGARFKGSLAPMLRIMLAKELGHLYRRVLYLDSDVFFEGGDLDRLMQVDLGSHALAAAKDIMQLHDPNHLMLDMRTMGLPLFNYFNSGVLVIDTKAFADQQIAERCWIVAASHPNALLLADQSILNGVFKGVYAELAPCWNWCSSNPNPMVTWTYPANFVHFVGTTKPFLASEKTMEARFRKGYEDFFRNFMPDMLTTLPPPRPSAPISLGIASSYFMNHYRVLKNVSAGIARFKDQWDVKL